MKNKMRDPSKVIAELGWKYCITVTKDQKFSITVEGYDYVIHVVSSTFADGLKLAVRKLLKKEHSTLKEARQELKMTAKTAITAIKIDSDPIERAKYTNIAKNIFPGINIDTLFGLKCLN